MRDIIEQWDKDYISGAELLQTIRAAHVSTNDEIRAALDAVARGRASRASACAAAALCELEGLGDPLETASIIRNETDDELTQPQWFLWIAGYTYNWICNAGLAACYTDFDDEHYADRIRVYDAIGAVHAAQILREADRTFGPQGPPASSSARAQALTDTLRQDLRDLSPRFVACDDEIFTRAFLYALEHPRDFRR